jgi:hypothetical protein
VSLEQLEELVDVVARPLVDDVLDELEEVAAIEPTLDLLDLLFRERLDDVFAKRLGIAFLNRIAPESRICRTARLSRWMSMRVSV